MKQLLQNVSTGELTVAEVPRPARGATSLLVATRYSLISAGTERAAIAIGRASLVGKARARPDLVAKVVEAARTEGVAATYAKVRGRLDEPNALGYSLCGVVLEACADAPAAPGDLVACAGAGYASHAEVVSVPRNLCARVPEDAAPEDAAYATVAAIALHGFRLSGAGLGDVVAVVGLGLVGQLALELASSAGCVVLGCDPDERRVQLARDAGCFASTQPLDLTAEAGRLTAGRGADAVLITAGSKSPAPLDTATAVARDRASVVLVGDVPVHSSRAAFFKKELRFVVSRSYGPGRYDPMYEERGVDYPAGYVRWTEGRNLEEVLRLIATGALRPARLTSHTFALADGPEAYRLLESDAPSMGILLRYPPGYADSRSVAVSSSRSGRRIGVRSSRRLRIGVIGAGAFSRGVLMPQLASRAQIAAVATASGVSAQASAARYGAATAVSDPAQIIEDSAIDAVVIATRHDTHARYAAQALRAGKHVFVEKPLALDEAELTDVAQAALDAPGILFVGFNRRFAPLVVRLRSELSGRGPLVVVYRVNAGRLPRDHWTHDPAVGGGRIIGEVCHFVDFAMSVTGGTPMTVDANAVGGGAEPREDSLAATIRLTDGSLAVIVYSALGDPGLAKERVEVFGETGAAVLDDFATLTLHRPAGTEEIKRRRDKGHTAEIDVFVRACRNSEQPWPVEDMLDTMRTTFRINERVVHGPA